MKFKKTLALGLILMTRIAAASSLYDCSSPRPEMAGFHNMVLFGAPDDQLYIYHLPLFAGQVNGTSGHILMHVYQGLWNIQLDAETKAAYDLKFSSEKSAAHPFPFFSIGPKGKTFKVPEMICDPHFSLNALTVYGHIEGNPDFPQPEPLLNQLSTVTTQGAPLLARRFDGISKPSLTYFIFGTPKQHYMVHFLTDDESSFDQIVAVKIIDADLEKLVAQKRGVLVTIPIAPESALIPIPGNPHQNSPNNKWKLPPSSFDISISVPDSESAVSGRIKIEGEIYFNNNDDLKK